MLQDSLFLQICAMLALTIVFFFAVLIAGNWKEFKDEVGDGAVPFIVVGTLITLGLLRGAF